MTHLPIAARRAAVAAIREEVRCRMVWAARLDLREQREVGAGFFAASRQLGRRLLACERTEITEIWAVVHRRNRLVLPYAVRGRFERRYSSLLHAVGRPVATGMLIATAREIAARESRRHHPVLDALVEVGCGWARDRLAGFELAEVV